jgi:hypothetical protein
MRQGGG